MAIYMSIHKFSCVNKAQKMCGETTQFDPTIGLSTFKQAFGVNTIVRVALEANHTATVRCSLSSNMNGARSNCAFKQKQSSQST